jgi:hypothetical protein
MLCKNYSLLNGQCTICYTGYALVSGNCVLGQNVYIPYCKMADSQGKCSQCIDRYYMSNGTCTSVDITCNNYDNNTGNCLDCVSGYVFQDKQCILPALGIDPYCTYYTNSYCTSCQTGYFLQNYACTLIDSNCLQFDYTSNACVSCQNNTSPSGPNCL